MQLSTTHETVKKEYHRSTGIGQSDKEVGTNLSALTLSHVRKKPWKYKINPLISSLNGKKAPKYHLSAGTEDLMRRG